MADLRPFPMDRLVGRARHVAALYVAKANDHDRRVYWDSICRTHTRIMRRVGFDDLTIDQQLAAFASRVNFEIGVLSVELAETPRNATSRDGGVTSRDGIRGIPRNDDNHPAA